MGVALYRSRLDFVSELGLLFESLELEILLGFKFSILFFVGELPWVVD